MIDVLTRERFLEPEECRGIVSEMRSVGGDEAAIYGAGKSIDPGVRKALIVQMSEEIKALVSDRLESARRAFAEYFGVELTSFEPPQFIRYRVGDFFVAHQDGNTPLIRDATLGRKVSVSIFLNDDGDYSGGSLVLHGTYPDWEYRQDITSAAGTLVAFRSETTHEVLPVTEGERFAIVAWFRE